MKDPEFFDLSYAKYSPWVEQFRGTEAKVEHDEADKIKSIKTRHVQPTVVIDKGTRWVDLIGNGPCNFILSDRVIEAFQAAGITGYSAYPVTIGKVRPKKLREQPHPWYFYIEVAGTLDLDLAASGLPAAESPDGVLSGRDRPRAIRYIPEPASWDGTDLMKLRNYPMRGIICSRRVIELARKERLTNFRFRPLGLLGHQEIGGKGVDYLGKTWPPAWYPPHARTIKSLDQWLDELSLESTAHPFEYHKQRIDPLLDFGLEALPGLKRILQTGSLLARKHAALVVYYLRTTDHFPIPDGVAALAAEYLPEGMLPAFKRPS